VNTDLAEGETLRQRVIVQMEKVLDLQSRVNELAVALVYELDNYYDVDYTGDPLMGHGNVPATVMELAHELLAALRKLGGVDETNTQT